MADKRFKEFIGIIKKSIELDPWAKERGLAGYCEEIKIEAEEVLEAVRKDDKENLKEELGDVLLDWAHACLLAEENGDFTMEDVISFVHDKINRRKPYLKENKRVSRPDARKAWLRAKEEEKKR
ncbi:nucleotide pyrophosphohydrolase [Candidatus Woesearchaeota archaeon]|nr:nucleotide pyrophosphohydrolase [Candidatus Woesearchaeota archaeon]